MSEHEPISGIEKNAKEILWDRKVEEVKKLTDKPGNEMDKAMVDTVTALNLLGLKTFLSCEGHEESLRFPYIQISKPTAPERKQWEAEFKKIRDDANRLLNEFYASRKIDDDIKLILEMFGATIASQIRHKRSEELSEIPPSDEKKSELILKIKQSQAEMKDFTEFLKNKFMQEKV